MTATRSGGTGSSTRSRSVVAAIFGLVGDLLVDFDAALAPLDDDPSLGADHPVNATSFIL